MTTMSLLGYGYALIVTTKCAKVVVSLEMCVEEVNGKIVVDAPWLERPIEADSWEDAYWLARLQQAQAIS
jgi:hypothetical protein